MLQFHCRPARPLADRQPIRRGSSRRPRLNLSISLRGGIRLLAVLQAGFLLGWAVLLVRADWPADAPPEVPAAPAEILLTKQEVRELLAGAPVLNSETQSFELQKGGETYSVRTTLDPQLQSLLVRHLDLKNSRYVGIVVMDSRDGRVLAMAGYDRTNPTGNPCIESRFPAASVFKIITAAAAVETCDLEPDSVLNYSGRRHTLYKSQLKAKTPKNANRTTLKESFAQSNNPVFGRLGVHHLGREVIASYAEAFGFNHEIDFELATHPSRIELPEEAYGLAEIASGFNRTTLISPLHGALMAAAIVNEGRLIAPTVVAEITTLGGRSLYRGRGSPDRQAIDPETSRVLAELMQATVRSGTASREFRKHADRRLFSKLDIGGKTGSISDGTPDTRFDWFVGFAREQAGEARIVFAVVVAHEEFIGTRAAAYAAMAIKAYFRAHFAASPSAAPSS
jgi:penicillin-binding protein A